MSDYNKPTFKYWENGLVVVNIANRLLNTSTIGFTRGSRNDWPGFIGGHHTGEHELIRHGFNLVMHSMVRRPNRKVLRKLRLTPFISEWHMNRLMRRFLGGSNGAGMNVFTLHSHTSYGHQDLLRREYLKLVFGTFARVIRDGMYDLRRMKQSDDSVISADEHLLECAAVGNETVENDEYVPIAAYKAALQLLYRKNPARHFGDSDLAQLDRIKLGSLKQMLQGSYVPKNMRIILLGPTRDQAIRWVRDAELDQIGTTGDWTPRQWNYDHSDDVPVLRTIREQIIDWPCAKMHHVRILLPTKPYTAYKDRLALQVLAGILKDRIEDATREKNRNRRGGVYHPSVEWDGTSSSGFLDIWFATRGDWTHTQDLIERVYRIFRELKDDRSTALDEQIYDGSYNLADNFREAYKYVPGVLADAMLLAMSNGDERCTKLMRYDKEIVQVTPRRIRQAARDYLDPDRHVRVIVRPLYIPQDVYDRTADTDKPFLKPFLRPAE